MRNLSIQLVAAALMVSTGAPHAFAANSESAFYINKEEGWFWYKDPKELKPKEPPQPQPPAPQPQQQEEKKAAEAKSDRPAVFSVQWLRENLDKLRDKAMDDPTPENVRNYYYAQRVMMDKADNFAKMSQQVAMTDPYLDENNNFPFATAAKNSLLKMQSKAKKDALHDLAGKAGIWFFFDGKCSYCEMQVHVVEHLAKDYGFPVMGISLDGQPVKGWKAPFRKDAGQFSSLGLTITPTLVLAVPPKKFLILSQGILSEDAADERILTAAAAEKLLPEELQKEIDVFSKGVLATEDMNSEEAKRLATEDEGAWVKYLRERIGKRR